MPKVRELTTDGVATPALLATLEELEQEPTDDFDLSEWAIPAEYTDELMANTALEHLNIVQTAGLNIIANRSVHNDGEVNRLVGVEAASKRALQEIKRHHPGAMKIVRDLATHQARLARTTRASATLAAKE